MFVDDLSLEDGLVDGHGVRLLTEGGGHGPPSARGHILPPVQAGPEKNV